MERDPLPQFESQPFGDRLFDSHSLAVAQERLLLLRRHRIFRMNLEDLLGFHGEAGKHVLGLLVDVGAAEPVIDANRLNAFHRADAGPVVFRQCLRERNAVPGDEAGMVLVACRRVIKGCVDREQKPQQKQ